MSQKILECSSLSMGDFANLCANYLAILRDEKDHEVKLSARGYTEAQIGATKKVKTNSVTDIFGIRFTKPLIKFHYPNLNIVLVYYENYERGNLPFEGPISEQPAQIIEVFNTITAIRYEHQKLQHKAQDKKPKPRK